MSTTHTIQLIGQTASIVEYHNEVAKIKGRTIGKTQQGDTEDWAPARIVLLPLLEYLQSAQVNPWQLCCDRLNRQVIAIKGGEFIESPVLYSYDDSAQGIKIIDGRHRLAALQQLGAICVVVMVPQSQASLFFTAFQ